MTPRRIHPENLIRIFLLGGGVCLLVGQATGSSLFAFIGGVMLAVVLLPASVIGTVMLIMRITGLGMARPNSSHPAQQGAQPDPNKPGDSGSS